ncbi:MAG: sigma-70 family RNA polymerase sigma factor, partial [Solirubrobacterales bacterium]
MSSHSSETPDAYILPGAEAGFRAAAEAPGADEPLADLYLRNAGWAYNLCYRTSLDRDEAARMLADGFAVAVRRYPEAQASKRTFASLLLTALGGPALDAGSRQVRERTDGPIDPEPPEAAIDTAAAIRDADRQLLVRSAVARLPVRQRKLLALHVGARIDMEAMADALGEHPAPVAGSLARAELALARELRPAAWWRSGVLADCAAALPTLARPDAGEPPHPPRGVAAHADGCERCAANAAAMAAARRDYAAWLALAPPPWRQTEAQLPQTGSEALARSLQLLQARGIRRLGVAATVSASALLIAMTAALSPSLRDRPEPAPAGAAVATAVTGGTPPTAAQALTIPGPKRLRDPTSALEGNSA